MKLFWWTLSSECFYDCPKIPVFTNVSWKVEIICLMHPFTLRAASDVADCELGSFLLAHGRLGCLIRNSTDTTSPKTQLLPRNSEALKTVKQFRSNQLFSMTVWCAWKGNIADVRCLVGPKFSGRNRDGASELTRLSLSVPCTLLRTSTWWKAAPLAWSKHGPAHLGVLYFPVASL